MKKLLVITSLVATLAGSAFGQGYMVFGGSTRQVWEGFTLAPLGPLTTNNVKVAFLWAANGSTPAVEALVNGVATNTTTANSTYSTAAAWALILDPTSNGGFTFATNYANASLISTNSASNGGWVYNPGTGAQFGVTNTASATVYTLFTIGWDATYANPYAAALAGASVGWTAAYNYTTVAQLGTALAQVMPKFGVAGTVPEPTTFALAGLGAAGLLIFRRRKA